jgi:hypothetical protein
VPLILLASRFAAFSIVLTYACLTISEKGIDDDFNQRPFDFEAALAPAREVRVNFAHDTGAHQAWRDAGTPEDDLQVCVGLRDGKYRMILLVWLVL